MTTVAIIQSDYIPWKGYFDIIHDVDIFVFLDDVQMTLRDWRSRNKIKTAKGTEWLTIPIKREARTQRICEVQLENTGWQKRHADSIRHNYSKTPYFKEYEELLSWLYREPHHTLSEYNRHSIRMICAYLSIETPLMYSLDLTPVGTKDDRLIDICRKLGANKYISGPSAKEYIHEEKFEEAGITIQYKEYTGYPEYRQLYPPFEHGVTILDLLFNCGPTAGQYIWGWREQAPSSAG